MSPIAGAQAKATTINPKRVFMISLLPVGAPSSASVIRLGEA
jgi:hypothetical protein